MNERKIRFPSSDRYAPYNDEPTIEAYFDKNYPKAEGESEIDWLLRHFPKLETEKNFDWFYRLAKDPVWVQGLTRWPVRISSLITRIDLLKDGSLLVYFLNEVAVQQNFDCYGYVMDKKIGAAINLGILPPQKHVRKGRYGIGFRAKWIVFEVLKFLGIETSFEMEMKLRSFFNTNQVTPTEKAKTSSPFEIYQPNKEQWSIQVNSLTDLENTRMVVLRNVLDRSPEFVGMPESLEKMRWEFYQVLLGTYQIVPGQLIVRAAISPEVLILLGTLPMVSDTQLGTLGFPDGYPAHFIDELGRMCVPLNGQTMLRDVPPTDLDFRVADSGPVTQFYAFWSQMNTTISLLQKLKGFDSKKL